MKKLKLILNIFNTTGLTKLLIFYLICFFSIAIIMVYVDPDIKTLADGLWFCFSSATTIGFGDIVVTSLIGKILTVVLTLFSILLIGFIPGVIVTYFTEFNKIKSNESVTAFLDKLEHLDELSPEELKLISQKIKEKRYKI